MAAIIGIDADILFVPDEDASGETCELPKWNSTTGAWDTTYPSNYDWVQFPE